MASLTKQEAAQLKALLQNDHWPVLEKYLAYQIASINAQPVSGQDAFQTLRMLHLNEGKVAGLEEFFSLLDTQAFKN